MRILVLGSNGFIGSHLTKFLKLESVYNVLEADIHVGHGKENYLQLKVQDTDFDDIFEAGFDFCINCTGAANVTKSIEDPRDDFFLNSINVFNILSSIRKKSPDCTLINLSSAAVYGNPEVLPIKETATLQPLSPYGFHKKISEEIMVEFSTLFNVSSVSLRIFSCFGPGLKKQIFWDAAKKMQAGDFSFFGSGNETRDFIYVEDVCRAIALLMEKEHSDHEVYNLASGVETKIKDAISSFQKIMKYKVSPSFTGVVHAGQPINWRADISKLTELGFKPRYSLEDGLKCYSEWLVASES